NHRWRNFRRDRPNRFVSSGGLSSDGKGSKQSQLQHSPSTHVCFNLRTRRHGMSFFNDGLGKQLTVTEPQQDAHIQDECRSVLTETLRVAATTNATAQSTVTELRSQTGKTYTQNSSPTCRANSSHSP